MTTRATSIFFGLVFGFALTSAARAYTRLDNGAGTYVALPAGDFVVVLDGLPHSASFDHQALEEAVDTAIATWAAVHSLPLTIRRAGGEEVIVKGVPIVTVIDQDRTWERAPVLAVTALTSAAKTGVIVSAEMDINDVAFDFTNEFSPKDDSSTKPRYDLATVLTHELGHALGLGHSTDESSIMFPDIPPGALGVPVLSDDDRAGIGAIYAGVTLPEKSPMDSPSDKPRAPTQQSSSTSTSTGATPGCSAIPGRAPSSTTLALFVCCLAAVVLREKSRVAR